MQAELEETRAEVLEARQVGDEYTAIVLPGLTREITRALSFRVMLALWLSGAAVGIYLLGPEAVLDAWQIRPLSQPSGSC